MQYTSKSIKTVLTAHQNQIYALCKSKSQFNDLKNLINQILTSDELAGNESVANAKQIFDNCSHNYNRYLSTMMTYMTGMRVS